MTGSSFPCDKATRPFFVRTTDVALVHFDPTFKFFSVRCYERGARLVLHFECGLVSLDHELFLKLESGYA